MPSFRQRREDFQRTDINRDSPARVDPLPGRSLQRGKSHPVLAFFLTAILALIVGAVGFAYLVRHATVGVWDHLASIVTGRSISINVTVPAVVSKIQRLQRLETVTYSMDSVVEGGRSSTVLPDFLVGDHMLLVVHGQSIAGVDLALLRAADVHISGKEIRVQLPPPQIFVTRLDNAHTRVYSRSTGILVPADPNLETQVRQKAEAQLQQSALQDGILKTAQMNARATVTSLLDGLGFQKVEVD